MDITEVASGELRPSVVCLETGLASVNAALVEMGGSIAGLRTTVIVTGVAFVALVVGVLTYGQTWFGIGATTQEIVRATVLEMQHAAVPAKP